jgi:hypothetical protein
VRIASSLRPDMIFGRDRNENDNRFDEQCEKIKR